MGKKPDDTTPIGEGDYESARKYQKEQHQFAKQGQVKEKAREAADALDSPEGKDLERARRETAKGAKGKS